MVCINNETVIDLLSPISIFENNIDNSGIESVTNSFNSNYDYNVSNEINTESNDSISNSSNIEFNVSVNTASPGFSDISNTSVNAGIDVISHALDPGHGPILNDPNDCNAQFNKSNHQHNYINQGRPVNSNFKNKIIDFKIDDEVKDLSDIKNDSVNTKTNKSNLIIKKFIDNNK